MKNIEIEHRTTTNIKKKKFLKVNDAGGKPERQKLVAFRSDTSASISLPARRTEVADAPAGESAQNAQKCLSRVVGESPLATAVAETEFERTLPPENERWRQWRGIVSTPRLDIS